MEFPQYRKYKNNKHFFKITSYSEFEEIHFIGTKTLVTKHHAKILPDRNLIQDLLHDVGKTCEMSSEDEYKNHLNH